MIKLLQKQNGAVFYASQCSRKNTEKSEQVMDTNHLKKSKFLRCLEFVVSQFTVLM